MTFVDNDEIKILEKDFFAYLKYDSSKIFGGTLGSKSGGVTAFAYTPNGRMIASALNNGTILVYDTLNKFLLSRIYNDSSI